MLSKEQLDKEIANLTMQINLKNENPNDKINNKKI